jgi:hypothetical protein
MSSSWEIESLLIAKVDGSYNELINEQFLKNIYDNLPKNQQVILTIVAKA